MKMPFQMTDEELVQECRNYDTIIQYYQAGRLSLGNHIMKLLRSDIQEVYDEIKWRMENPLPINEEDEQ